MKKLLLVFLIVFTTNAFAVSMDSTMQTVPQLLDSIQRIMKREHIPGLLLSLVSRDSMIFSGGLGMAALKNNIPINERHLFRFGSVSKSFAALAILQLVEQGKLNLNDHLRDIAPEVPFDNKWETTEPLKVVHLLEHTTGFDDMHFAAMHNQTDRELPLLEMIGKHANSLHCRWKPGSRFSYSNSGYVIVTYLIEKFSGQNYHDYMAQHVLGPIGMAESNFNSFIPAGSESDYAQGYSWNGESYDDVPFNAINGAAAGTLNSSARDMGRFVQCLLNNGRSGETAVVSPASIMRMETPASSFASRSGKTNGYALANFRRRQGTWAWLQGHSGGIDGFSSYYGYNREYGVGFALSNNAQESNKAIINVVTDFLTRDLTPPSRKTVSMDLAAIQTYLGYYSFASSRIEILTFVDRLLNGMELKIDNDTLRLKTLFEPAVKLIPASSNTFYRNDNLETDVILTKDEDGRPVYIFDAYYYEKTSAIAYWVPLSIIVLSIVLLVTYIPYSLVWLIRIRRSSLEGIYVRLLPLLSIGALIATFFIFGAMFDPLIDAGQLNWKTVGYALFSVMWLVLSVWSLAAILRRYSAVHRKVTALYLSLVVLANVTLSMYLFYNGLIGKCFWLY
ncbi:beta-lactamase family protein [bacterium]|nr:beta-lactamase family protein [bacterium]